MWLLVSTALMACLLPAEAQAASCSFMNAAGMLFGTYDVFDPAPLDTTGSITFLCNGVGPSDMLTVELSAGGASNAMDRRMRHGSDSLSYNLYLDAARTLVWGNGMGGTSIQGPFVPPDGISQTLIIHGRMPARQNVPVGMYADTIIATILF
jgi:spore coat protein U-like protein